MVLPQAEQLNRHSVNTSEGSREGLGRKGLTCCKEELWVCTDKGIAGLRITGEAEERLESLQSMLKLRGRAKSLKLRGRSINSVGEADWKA